MALNSSVSIEESYVSLASWEIAIGQGDRAIDT